MRSGIAEWNSDVCRVINGDRPVQNLYTYTKTRYNSYVALQLR